jgi:hypothetical protein
MERNWALQEKLQKGVSKRVLSKSAAGLAFGNQKDASRLQQSQDYRDYSREKDCSNRSLCIPPGTKNFIYNHERGRIKQVELKRFANGNDYLLSRCTGKLVGVAPSRWKVVTFGRC